jgi:hypothetical protein
MNPNSYYSTGASKCKDCVSLTEDWDYCLGTRHFIHSDCGAIESQCKCKIEPPKDREKLLFIAQLAGLKI